MTDNGTTLDENLFPDDKPQVEYYATIAQRFANYIIDLVIIYIIAILFSIFLLSIDMLYLVDHWLYSKLIFISLSFSYYLIMEFNFNKTLGKMITRTTVVTESGEPLTLKTIAIRSISRSVPLEQFSAFSNSQVMWHDSWSKTRVVKSSSVNE